jgi:hypothetical protein
MYSQSWIMFATVVLEIRAFWTAVFILKFYARRTVLIYMVICPLCV